MYSAEGGVGLAAPMAGLNLRIAIVDAGDGSPIVLINPHILKLSDNYVEMMEANLCIPGVMARVKRPETVTLRAYDHQGVLLEKTFSGFTARIILHEIDVLDGKMFFDLVSADELINVSPDVLTTKALKYIHQNGGAAQEVTQGDCSMHYFNAVTLSPELLNIQHTVLRQKCTPVNFEEWKREQLREIIKEMLWLQHHLEGVGMAAPQVGLNIQLSVIDNRKDPPLVLINPTIIERSTETERAPEACLSIPGYSGEVVRAKSVTVKAWDAHEKPFELSAEGYLARIIQHEVDHLNGILFTDHLESLDELEAVDADTLANRAIQLLYPI